MYHDQIIVPEEFIGLVIGKKGKTINKIRKKFKLNITIENNIFSISSKNKIKLNEAVKYIQNIYIDKNYETCPICLDKLDSRKNFVTTECGHSFHLSCLTQSLNTKNSCPMCREEINLIEPINEDLIIQKTILAIRRSNYSFFLYNYPYDIYNYQLIVEEFIKEPIRYALRCL